jgi:uncharacterized protein DUF664
MTCTELLLDAFGRVPVVVRDAVDDLTPEQLAYRPNEAANSIAWLVWHISRVQDDHVAEVAGSQQVWTSGGWRQRFGLPFGAGATGYGHGPDDVAKVRADSDLLTGYFEAVDKATDQYVRGLVERDFDRIVDERWDPPVTLAVRLVSVVSDNLQHAGQAAYLRGLIERRR